jgi:hypothetical protein
VMISLKKTGKREKGASSKTKEKVNLFPQL